MMKTLLTAAAALLLTAPVVVVAQGNVLEGCVTQFDASRDYFPDKVGPTESLFWDINYFNNYKVLRNEISGESYVLYQCGTPIPTQETGHNFFIPVPINSCAVSSTTIVPHLELLGLRTKIKALTGFAGGSVSSPCLTQMVADGLVQDAGSDVANLNALLAIDTNIVSFTGDSTSADTDLVNVTVSDFMESGNLPTFEWHKYLAAFFNAEAKANEVYEDSKDRYECSGDEAANIVAEQDGGVRPTVVWARYVDFQGTKGWDVAQCPNYYCEYADLCAANIVNSRAGTIDFFGTMLFTTEDFVELAKDADHWIYPGRNWDVAVAVHGDILQDFVSVRNQQVFDTEGSGPNSWFEQRVAEFDIVLQDFCEVVGTAGPLHERTWFRNVFTETVGELGFECADINAPLETRATSCQLINIPLGFCFAADMQVELESGEFVAIQDLKIGSVVRSGVDGSFSRVYGFGHKQDNQNVDYVQLHSQQLEKPVEMTKDHMLFLGNGQTIAAGSVKIGDEILSASAEVVTVASIKSVNRRGAYAPFTESGSIVVNGAVASCYVSFGNDMVLAEQWLAHACLAPYRMYCQAVGGCAHETYTDEGIATWIVGPLAFAQWLVSQHSIVLSILMPPVFLLAGLWRLFEAVGLAALTVLLALSLQHASKKVAE